jgi:general L-amino acid transport system substrate-binding protein
MVCSCNALQRHYRSLIVTRRERLNERFEVSASVREEEILMQRNSKLLKLLAVVFAFVLIAAACGDDDDSGTQASSDDGSGDDGSGDDGSGDDDVTLTQDGSVLDTVQSRGTLNCGVATVSIAFSTLDPDGRRIGFDADYCRVVAAAVLGDAEAVNFVPLTAAERFTAVQTGDVDLLMRNTTWTQSRDTDIGMDFGPTTYYDGQQLMAREADGFSSASGVADIGGAVVCTNAGTTTEKNLSDAAAAAGVEVTLNTFEDFDIVTDNFISGACDVITTDGSGLVGRKSVQEPDGENWVIFPAAPISKEPLGPTYGQNDSAWADAINWAVYATFIADEKGINSANAASIVGNDDFDAEAQRLMGGEGELQSIMGLAPDAFMVVIQEVGNYDEIYERHLVPLGLTREGGFNANWTEGGLIYAPPAR